jgi:hypothetical protein
MMTMMTKYLCTSCLNNTVKFDHYTLLGQKFGVCEKCNKTADVNKIEIEEPPQLTLKDIDKTFQISNTKTLKTNLRKGMDLEMGVLQAFRYVLDNKEGYTRVEFPYGGCYIVVAKLKEKV